MLKEDGWYACDDCDVLGIGDECWHCGNVDLYRGNGCKWPGGNGKRSEEDRPYMGGHNYVEYASLHTDERDVTWEMILRDEGEPSRF